MNVLVVLIPISLLLGGLGLWAFVWTVRSDQYEDAEGAAARILLDDDAPAAPDEANSAPPASGPG